MKDGWYQFAPKRNPKSLTMAHYVKDDVIVCKVIVKPQGKQGIHKAKASAQKCPKCCVRCVSRFGFGG